MSEQEFTVRIPQRNEQKKFYVMKFNASLGIDVSKWNQVRMVRENNQKVKAQGEQEEPKFGAGSVFGKEQKEEARRKKFGMVSKKYDPDAQPWLMRVGSKKEGKHYKGLREGGVSNNTTYYVFTHAQDGSFEAHPVKEWYNFTPRVNYKTLNAEEAEEKFAERSKILNHWAVMVNKKLRPDADDADELDGDEGGGGKGSKKSGNKFKVSDMDDWVDDEDGLDSSDESDGEDGGSKKKKKRKEEGKKGKDSRQKKKKSKYDVENEAFEDSDDGDGECREVDYITDESSEGEEEMAEAVELKGVEQDEGLSKLLDSESSSDEDEDGKKKEDKDKNKDDDDDEDGGEKSKKGKKGKKKSKDEKAKDKDDDGKSGGKKSAAGSRATTPTPSDAAEAAEKAAGEKKRKALVDNILDPNAGPEPKKSRMDPLSTGSSSSGGGGVAATSTEAMFEEDVRRYLARKPMTTTEILKKIKSRKTTIPKEELMPLLVSALKRINPHKQKSKGIMYLSLKSNK